jgi:hypothetical protein
MAKLVILAGGNTENRMVVDGTRGLVTINKNNADDENPFGSIAIQGTFVKSVGGNVRIKTPIAYLRGDVNKLKVLIEACDLRAGDDFSAKVEESWTIVARETDKPQWENQPYLENPQTHQAILNSDGNKIYNRHELVPEFVGDERNPEAVDQTFPRLQSMQSPTIPTVEQVEEEVFTEAMEEEPASVEDEDTSAE